MEITRMAKPPANKAKVSIWRCNGCDVVHMSVGKMVLNFTSDEFSEFAGMVGDIDAARWTTVGREYTLLDLAALDHDESSPAAATVH